MHTDPTLVEPTIPGGTPPPADPGRPTRRRLLIAGAAALAVVIGIAALVVTPGSSAGSRGPAPGADVLSAATGSTSTSSTSTTLDPTEADAAAVEAPAGGATGPSGLLAFAPGSLQLDADTDEVVFTLRNDGAAAAGWSTDAAPAPWVAVAPSAGTLDPGEAVEVTVTVDRGDLANGAHAVALVLDSDAPFEEALQSVEVSVTVEKAEIEQVAAAPQVICALQSPGAGPKVAVVVAMGQHLPRADTIQAGFDTPGPNVFKAMDYDEANDRFVTTYSSTAIGAHVASVEAYGEDAVSGAVGAVPINVIWCA
jgi:hypothetical protein